MEDADPESVTFYVKLEENEVQNVRFRMELTDAKAKDPEGVYDVYEKWKVLIELSEENFEEVDVFSSSVKYLWMALLMP